VADNPLQTAQTNDAQNLARNSVSQILSQQLNRFTGNYLNGIVELNLNLNSFEDYSSGTGRRENPVEYCCFKRLIE